VAFHEYLNPNTSIVDRPGYRLSITTSIDPTRLDVSGCKILPAAQVYEVQARGRNLIRTRGRHVAVTEVGKDV
jgi:hypothetical protein